MNLAFGLLNKEIEIEPMIVYGHHGFDLLVKKKTLRAPLAPWEHPLKYSLHLETSPLIDTLMIYPI